MCMAARLNLAINHHLVHCTPRHWPEIILSWWMWNLGAWTSCTDSTRLHMQLRQWYLYQSQPSRALRQMHAIVSIELTQSFAMNDSSICSNEHNQHSHSRCLGHAYLTTVPPWWPVVSQWMLDRNPKGGTRHMSHTPPGKQYTYHDANENNVVLLMQTLMAQVCVCSSALPNIWERDQLTRRQQNKLALNSESRARDAVYMKYSHRNASQWI